MILNFNGVLITPIQLKKSLIFNWFFFYCIWSIFYSILITRFVSLAWYFLFFCKSVYLRCIRIWIRRLSLVYFPPYKITEMFFRGNGVIFPIVASFNTLKVSSSEIYSILSSIWPFHEDTRFYHALNSVG